MRFQVNNKGGRCVWAHQDELFCGNCLKKYDSKKDDFWYFFDYNDKIYCERCTKVDYPLPLSGQNAAGGKPKYVFWLIDEFRYGGKTE